MLWKQSLSSKLLDKQARLEESVCERATLSVKLQEASARAFRAEQELREARGDSLEGGVGGGEFFFPRFVCVVPACFRGRFFLACVC